MLVAPVRSARLIASDHVPTLLGVARFAEPWRTRAEFRLVAPKATIVPGGREVPASWGRGANHRDDPGPDDLGQPVPGADDLGQPGVICYRIR